MQVFEGNNEFSQYGKIQYGSRSEECSRAYIHIFKIIYKSCRTLRILTGSKQAEPKPEYLGQKNNGPMVDVQNKISAQTEQPTPCCLLEQCGSVSFIRILTLSVATERVPKGVTSQRSSHSDVV